MAHLGILGPVAVAAGVAAGWVAVSAPEPARNLASVPSQVIDARFAADLDGAALPPPGWFTAILDGTQQPALTSSNLAYMAATVRGVPSSIPGATAQFAAVEPAAAEPAIESAAIEPAAEAPVGVKGPKGPMLASASATPAMLKGPAGDMPVRTSAAPETPKPAPAPRPKKAAPPPPSHNVLNDAQITSIKQRLHLTPDQEAYWPAVEAALREIEWNKRARAHAQTVAQAGSAQAIDVNSPPVQRLKSAAFPLLMSFNEGQKQEVRELVQVIGLGKLAQQF
jgi:hypothetical protein